jgi:hypothetical protein
MTNAELLKQEKVFATIVELQNNISNNKTFIIEIPHSYEESQY